MQLRLVLFWMAVGSGTLLVVLNWGRGGPEYTPERKRDKEPPAWVNGASARRA